MWFAFGAVLMTFPSLRIRPDLVFKFSYHTKLTVLRNFPVCTVDEFTSPNTSKLA